MQQSQVAAAMQAHLSGQLKSFFYDAEAGSVDIDPVVIPARSNPYNLMVGVVVTC